jgi:ABC-type multidrug transport system fused ATPase/permease subunit
LKELLLRRKAKFYQYLFATFLFMVEYFLAMGIVSLILDVVEKKDAIYFRNVVIIIIVFIIYSPINFLISRMLRLRYMRDTILDVRRQAFDKIMSMTFRQFSHKSKEIYLSNLVNDINTFENKFFYSFLNFIINVGMSLFSMIILMFLDIKLAIGMLFLSAFLYILASIFTKKTQKLQLEVSDLNEKFTLEISNDFNGMEILKLNNMEDKFLLKSMSILNNLEKKKQYAGIFTDFQRYVIRILTTISSAIIMVYLAYTYGGSSLGIGAMCFQLCSSMGNYLIGAFPMYNQMKASISIYEKIAKSIGEANTNEREKEEFEFKQEIQVKNLNFQYDSKVIIKQAEFTLEKGKKYLIKGASGSGKSTLLNLLSMGSEEYTGSIHVDGTDYKDISEKSFQNKVAFIYQEVFLFEDTIKNNISLYRDISEDNINNAVLACGLNDMLKDKKDGIQERLLENGKNLSGGQRQRISIARAIAKEADILFIDEGTSSLNEELGREIEKVFLELNNTVVAISHRYYEGVTDKYDYVLEIKNGYVSCYSGKEYFEEVAVC